MSVERGTGWHRLVRVGGEAGLLGLASALMARFEAPLREDGGPGIVALELAGSARAEEILDSWGHAGRAAARRLVWSDFAYMLVYGWTAHRWLRRSLPETVDPVRARVLTGLPLVAVAADAVEGRALLSQLDEKNGRQRSWAAQVSRVAATMKFVALAAAVVGVLDARVRRG